MARQAVTIAQPKWFIVAGIALIIAFVFFWPYLPLITFAAMMAYLFLGSYRWFAERMKNSLAASLTMVLSVIIVVAPIAIIVTMAIAQGLSAAEQLSITATDPNNPIVIAAQPFIDATNSSESLVTTEDVQAFAKETLPTMLRSLLDIIIGIAGSLPALMTGFIIYGFLVVTFLTQHKAIRRIIKDVSPFDDATNKLYLTRAGIMIKGSLQGQLLIALILGVSCALTLFIIGYGQYFFFFVIILTLLSLVPLGTGVIMMPLAIIAMLTGQFWEGLWVMLIYLIVICNLDNFLRPRLMPKKVKISPALITLATFSGLFYFGILGIVYGPLIAIILTTTLEIYREHKLAHHPRTA